MQTGRGDRKVQRWEVGGRNQMKGIIGVIVGAFLGAIVGVCTGIFIINSLGAIDEVRNQYDRWDFL